MGKAVWFGLLLAAAQVVSSTFSLCGRSLYCTPPARRIADSAGLNIATAAWDPCRSGDVALVLAEPRPIDPTVVFRLNHNPM
jgi:hypothetical protein